MYDPRFKKIIKKELPRRDTFWNWVIFISGLLLVFFYVINSTFIYLGFILILYITYGKLGSLNYTYSYLRSRYLKIKHNSDITNRNAFIQTLENRLKRSSVLRNKPNGITPIVEYIDSFEKPGLSIYDFEDSMIYITTLQVWQAENNLVLDDEWGNFRRQQIDDIKEYLSIANQL